MKLLNKLCVGILPLIPVMMVSCQKTQTASAESQATRFGEGGDPSAEVSKIEETATDAATDAVEKKVEAATDAATKPSGRNRFGFGGDKPIKPLSRDTPPQIKKEVKEEVKEKLTTNAPLLKNIEAPKVPKPPIPPPPTTPPAPSADEIVRLGFANTVPGDNLHVTLPGEYSSLGPISIERMDASGNGLGSSWARGTQMQIPNQSIPGGKIYFKVP